MGDFFTTSLSPVWENYFTEVSHFGDMSPKEENFTQASKNSPKRETFAYIPSCTITDLGHHHRLAFTSTSRMVNGNCAVIGCTNSTYRLKIWKKSTCEIHEAIAHNEKTMAESPKKGMSIERETFLLHLVAKEML